MAVQKTMNIVAITGTYTNNQGQEKKRYLTCGTLFIYDDGGMSIKLDAVPTNFDGKLAVYEKEDRNQQQGQQGGYQQQQQQGGYAPQQGQQYQQPQQQGGYAPQQQAPQQTYQAPHGDVPVYNEPAPQGGYAPQNQQSGYPRQ